MTLANFKTYVKQVFKRTDKDTEIVQAYNDMIMWVSSYMPHAGYKYQSYIYTVSGTPDYPLPSDLIYLIHPVRLLEGSGANDSGYPMNLISKQQYDIKEPNPRRTSPSTGKPVDYTIFSRSILPSPIPNKSTYLLEIDWTKRPVSQSGDSDVTYLGSEWDEVLRHGTLERLYEMLELFDESDHWASKYRNQEGSPIGMCKKLFDIERDREVPAIGQVKANIL